MTDVEVACVAVGDGWACTVRVRDEDATTEHEVTVRPADAVAHRVHTVVDAERLIRETFAFLLEREPKESILRTFGLDIVRRYFPDYEREIRRRVAH